MVGKNGKLIRGLTIIVFTTCPILAAPQPKLPTADIQPTPSLPIRASSQFENKYLALEDELRRPSRPRENSGVAPGGSGGHFTNEWVILVPEGEEKAKEVADIFEHEFLREVHGFPNHFIIKKREHPERNTSHSEEITTQLLNHELVVSAKQQIATHPESRSILPPPDDEPHLVSSSSKEINEPKWTTGDPRAAAEVYEATVPLSEIRKEDQEERERNRLNQDRTKDILTDEKENAVDALVRMVKESGQPVGPVIDLVNKTASNIGGVNARQTRDDILEQLLQLDPIKGKDLQHEGEVNNEMMKTENENNGIINLVQGALIQLLNRWTGQLPDALESPPSGQSFILPGQKTLDKKSKRVSDVIVEPAGGDNVEDLRRSPATDDKGNDDVDVQDDEDNVDGNNEADYTDGFWRRGLEELEENYPQAPGLNQMQGNNDSDGGRKVKRDVVVQGTIAQQVTAALEIGSENSFGSSRYLPLFNDEKWKDQWYLHDYRNGQDLLHKPINDLNVVPVYTKYELSGLGVRIVIPDDGLEHTHQDLKDNYDPSISYDLNSNDGDPTPRMTNPPRNIHGTRCAGEIAMVANNGKCGAGIAFRAKIGGIRMLDGVSTDRVEGEALKFKHYWVDIYSNSWGPKDDGQTLEHLGQLTTHALVDGITESRAGRGALYVFAAGNGKVKGDNCACDGYVSSIFTMAVATCDRYGHVSPYSERCSAVIATAFSSGLNGQHVVTTDVNNGCTQVHTGTSAAAPLVAGILALLLEAKPEITWRDAQHLIIWTSEVAPLADNYGWTVNGFGFLVHQDFGFGMVNAFNLITAAKTWDNVQESNICAVPVEIGDNNILHSDVASQFDILTDACQGHPDGEINYLEHVQLNVDIAYPVRGDLQIVLYSPMGTRSHLLEARPLDKDSYGFSGWTFSTLHSWGENPRGLWIIQIFDVRGNNIENGLIHKLKLILHGTSAIPDHYKNGPRPYDPFDAKV